MILAVPSVLGPITFSSPLMLYGALATAAPVVVHLILRQRHRRVPFPAFRFVLAAHHAGKRTSRLRHFLLLLLRMMLILLLVGILAGPSIQTTKRVVAASVPADVVFCFDDSASMGYRSESRSRLQQAADYADDLLSDGLRFPPGSRFTVMVASAPDRTESLTPVLSAIRSSFERLRSEPHDLGVADSLIAGYRLLAGSDRTRKEIYLFNDLTEHSWRNVETATPLMTADVSAICVDVGQESSQNVMLSLPPADARILPAEAPLFFEVAVRSFDLAGPRQVELSVDGQVAARSATLNLQSNSRQGVLLDSGPLQRGIHHLSMRLTESDSLEIDNTRFLTVEVGDPVKIIVVGNGAPDEPASEARLAMTMISPNVLNASQSYYEVFQVSVSDLASKLEGQPNVIILADVARPSDEDWTRLTAFVRSGGVLIVMPGDSMQLSAYAPATPLIGVTPTRIEVLSKPARMVLPNLAYPYLRPFLDPSNDSLSERSAFRRLLLGAPVPASRVLAHFSDGPPAILAQEVGLGACILLAFSPSPEWGDFGTQAGPLLVFLHTMLRHHTPESAYVIQFQCRMRAAIKPTGIPTDATAWVRPFNEADSRWEALKRDEQGAFVVGTDHPGAFDLEFRHPEQAIRGGYAVNLPDAESDPARLGRDRLASLFPEGRFLTTSGNERPAPSQHEQQVGRNIAGELALVLLAGLVAESLFSNRLYGKTGL